MKHNDIKVLMLSTDRNIFMSGSAVQERISTYGKYFSELHIVVSTAQESGLKAVQLSKNVWIYPTSSISRWFYIIDFYRQGRKILRNINSRSNTVITTQDPFETGLVGVLLKMAYRVKLHVQVHTNLFSNYFVRSHVLNRFRVFLSRFVFRRTDRIRVVSRHLKERLCKLYPTLVGRCDVLPIYVDLDALQMKKPTFILKERYPFMEVIILMVGRLEKEKGIDTALHVCQKLFLENSNFGLVIAGNGSGQNELEKLVTKLGLTKQVRFVGRQDDMVSLFKGADIFLHTSTYEGYGMVLVEAGASGLPIVSTNVGVVRDIYKDGESAYICPVNDVECLTTKLRILLNDREKREYLGFKARVEVEKKICSRDEYFMSFAKGIVKTL